MQRLRVRYGKRGRLRFSSHRDFQRALERAVRRAEVPVAYSAGFSPHPRISYANAAPTGAASEAEYLEIATTRHCDPETLRRALDEALPPGLDVLEVVPVRSGALAERLEASVWRIELFDVPDAEARAALTAFLAADEVRVSRLTKQGVRTFDARAAVHSARVLGAAGDHGSEPRGTVDPPAASAEPTGDAPRVLDGPESRNGVTEGRTSCTARCCAILEVVVRHFTPAVRPDDVLAALRVVAQLAPPSPVRVTRLAQGLLDPAGGTVADPLAADKDAGGA